MDLAALDIISAVINSVKYSNSKSYEYLQKFVVLVNCLSNYIGDDLTYIVSTAALLKNIGVMGETPEEKKRNIYKSAEIIRVMPEIIPQQYIIADVILEINERLDGSGPYEKTDISDAAQLVGIVDDYLNIQDFEILKNEERYCQKIVEKLAETLKIFSNKLNDTTWREAKFYEIIMFNSKNKIEIKGVEEEQFLSSIATIIDTQHEYTGGHTKRVATYSYALAKHLGYKGSQLSEIRYAAYLHDIGKVAIDFELLDKPSSLTVKEFEVVKSHAEYSYKILKDSPTLKDLSFGALHHERIDGKGYPFGLSGENIPEEAKIIAIADVLDALTSNRPYRKPVTFKQALEIMEESMVGTALDSEIFKVAKELF